MDPIRPPNTLATAVRTVVRFWFPVAAGLAAYLVTSAVLPAFMQSTAVTSSVSPLNRLYAEHHCAATAGPGRTMLLISTPSSGAQLVEAATTQDGRLAERDRFTDERATLYGWCER